MPDTERIRVLIVDDIAETRENIRRSLQFDSEIEVAGTARSGNEAIQLSKELKPDVIIMDINMPDMDGISATEEIRKANPFVQVIILSVQSDPSYMRRAMLVGARDFLSKPPSIDELIAAIRRAGKMAAEIKQKQVQAVAQRVGTGPLTGPLAAQFGKIIIIYSPKGGTGCTTIATNLAIALKNDDNNVLLVDGNIQYGDVVVFLNEQVKNYVLDLTTRVDEIDSDVVQEVVSTHSSSGIKILAGSPSPEQASKVSGEEFGKLLDFLRGIYDYVVVDTASYLTEVVQASLDVTDLIVLVTTQDIPAIKNSSLFLNLTDASGIQRKRIVFVMNQYDRRISISTERIAENLKQEIAIAIPFDEKLMVTNSINRGVPLIIDHKNHPVSKGISALGQIIVKKLAQIDDPE
ncbi:MAG: response regulator [Anaerolineaceae bacterium]|nr:response regulator [Anaerolineaceae bacterium]